MYELGTPLLLRAVMTIGSVARVSRSSRQKSGTNFELSDVESVDGRASSYLSFEGPQNGNTTDRLRKIFVYRVVESSRNGVERTNNGRGSLVIFIVDPTDRNNENLNIQSDNDGSDANEFNGHPKGFSARAYMWFVNPNSANVTDVPPLRRIFRKFCTDPTAQCKLVGVQSKSMSEAATLCNDRITQLTQERRAPTMVIAQGKLISTTINNHCVVRYFSFLAD